VFLLFDNIVIMNSIYLSIHETYYRQHTLRAVSHFVEEEEEEEEEEDRRQYIIEKRRFPVLLPTNFYLLKLAHMAGAFLALRARCYNAIFSSSTIYFSFNIYALYVSAVQ